MINSTLDLVIQGRLPPPLSRYKIRKILLTVLKRLKISKAVIGLSFASENKISELNKVYYSTKKPTDVLSFAYHEKDSRVLEGDIVVCAFHAKKQAVKAGVEPEEEYARLLIHGLMHIAGYDHRTKRQEVEMFKLQERILKAL